MTTIIARSSETTHWYRQDGSPQYTVKAKDGSDRNTTLRDARVMNLVPSVTTIIKTAASPGLEAWKSEQMLLAALTLPRVEGESEKELLKRIVQDSKETARQAAERGTRVHEDVEKHFAGEMNDRPELGVAVERSLASFFGLPDKTPWKVEHAFAWGGFGGKVDLHHPITKCAPHGLVVDIKSKEFGPDDEIKAYDEHLMQLAAYRNGLEIPNARCANIFVSVSHPGLVSIIEWNAEDLTRGWDMFSCLLKYWSIKNKFGI